MPYPLHHRATFVYIIIYQVYRGHEDWKARRLVTLVSSPLSNFFFKSFAGLYISTAGVDDTSAGWSTACVIFVYATSYVPVNVYNIRLTAHAAERLSDEMVSFYRQVYYYSTCLLPEMVNKDE